ncbi:bifunctional glutamate N-acetyltransferase/amino-acid acetyltransferase ArgJ [Lactococcus allomyrinae]|uniref:Arginine biosynthesis bifunctional protein ArgJ n=1 Tax=Lactococcus allomyrinae TaxID=2419773 RepID=A0A387BFR6_9LACT|nr:bifunctional glutamate N-acetyltransferase/amino-acid acetyltransferase ArgJ [Lactococcus allomyrinae]AYG00269.1 bifunctional glutamate N-acetyltransferase/amino-acid acetyltransferase ArgJ [Lactococcus allomyrinae]
MKEVEGTIASPKGFSADAVHAQLKYKNLDLGIILSEVPAAIAGVFTTNKVYAAPVKLNREIIKNGKAQAIVCNSAVANAVTGDEGWQNALKTQKMIADKFNLVQEHVAVCSTGVIGVQLPMEKMATGISKLSKVGNPAGFAQAILTTDTKIKTINLEEEIGGKIVKMSGVCKGSGMIHPNMATMLAFITTDAKIAQSLLQKTLSALIETTFNQITVDGDTSTNDTVLILANGMAANEEILEGTKDYLLFRQMLEKVCQVLAQKIAADGEGATKLIEVTVKGAFDSLSARLIAKKIVGSSLVKTAIFGADPNWGRIVSSIGQAADFEVDDIELKIQDELVLYHSTPVQFEAAFLSEKLKENMISIVVDLNCGTGNGQAWGCDLTYKYVEINALYTS